jgi:hypothetical protein
MKEYPNKWAEIRDTPVESFRPMRFRDVFMRAGCWDSELEGMVIRVENSETGTITEKRYKRIGRALNYQSEQEALGNIVTSYDNEQLYCTQGFNDSDDED